MKTTLNYISKGRRIIKSEQHNLYVINYQDGGFITVHSSDEIMLHTYPPDNSQFVYDSEFKFKRSWASALYKPRQSPVVQSKNYQPARPDYKRAN